MNIDSPSSRKARDAPRAHLEISTLQELEQYLKANPLVFPHPDDVKHLVEEEFPFITSKPTSADCDESILKQQQDKLPYQLGQWIERLGNDMQWHLEPIRRIIVFQDTPTAVWYKTEAAVLVQSDHARCSEEGVKRQFGMRPHLWQQYALLKLEEVLRFQQAHEYDFEVFNCTAFAERMWIKWLHDERNNDFLILYQSKPKHVQIKLEHHMLSPFRMMADINETWDLDSARCSVYQYNSLLGSGFTTSIVILAIQLIVPCLLLIFQVRSSPRFPAFTVQPNVSSLDVETMFTVQWEEFCFEPIGIDGILMQYVVFFVYWTRVVPEVVYSFYDTVGDSPTVQSKINSLRKLTWDQSDDTVAMKCGSRLRNVMKAFYVAAINLLMLFCIFLSDNTVSIILNALAIEFVYDFDREVAQMFWFDEGKRYLRAGVLELAIRGTLLLEHFQSPQAFCWFYDCDLEEYTKAMGGRAIYDVKQAAVDRANPKFQTAKHKLWAASAKVAKRLKRTEALWQFEEQVANFGIVDQFFYSVLPTKFRNRFASGIFNRYDNYFTWSRWYIFSFSFKPETNTQKHREKVLFMPRVPEINTVSSAGKSWTSNFQGVMNFSPQSIESPTIRFLRWCLAALMFGEVLTIIRVVIRRKQYLQVPFMFLDGVFEWVTYIFVLFTFPLGLFAYMFLIVYCQRVMTNTADSWLYNGDVVFGG